MLKVQKKNDGGSGGGDIVIWSGDKVFQKEKNLRMDKAAECNRNWLSE